MDSKLVICIGAALIDEIFTSNEMIHEGTSNPSNYKKSIGGVARNVAGLLAQLDQQVQLISHFGNDPEGKWLMDACLSAGIGLSHALQNEKPTGRYLALLHPNGELFTAASYSCIDTEITPAFLAGKTSFLKTASLLVIDCNLSADCIQWIVSFSAREHIPCIVEPVSVSKAKRLQHIELNNVLLFTPNTDELAALSVAGEFESAIQTLLDLGIKNIWIRSGKKGSINYSKSKNYQLEAPRVEVVDTTGAGDAALAGWIYAWLLDYDPEVCLKYGHALASMILQTKGAELPHLNRTMLTSAFENYQ